MNRVPCGLFLFRENYTSLYERKTYYKGETIMLVIKLGLCALAYAFCKGMDEASRHRVCVIDEREVSKAA